ncbi:portal protein [Paenirhodobacter sp. CAU 1674]|uniref:portal protein n=1 Tax=Paenirhodobacter sp. CAU 1674 TaxID=3032596 RepID=UPI0023D9A86A|nr:portal protein [Paenirhodobacter sp. CAU 1674]MDF2143207.1 portal protein [Paenirhodobacter sp. CAU 1674]
MNEASAIREKAPEAELAMRRWQELKSDRSMHEGTWEGIAELIRPQRGGFSSDDPMGRQMLKPLSSAPISAQSNFAAGLYGQLSNPANRWFGLATEDEDLNAWHPAKLWLDTVTSRILNSFQAAVSPFYSATTQIFSDLAAFGNGAQYDEVVTAERKILDVTLSLAEVCYDIDGFGRVWEVVRRFQLRPAAAMSMFKGALPQKVIDMAEKGSTDKITFYHHVFKNDDWRQGMLGTKGKRWISRYACEVENSLLRESGYDEMPFFAPRWDVETGAIYGTGPGFVALASARVHHKMDDATLRAAQMAADPAVLAPDKGDWPLDGRIRPGAVVYGGMNIRGQRMLDVLNQTGGINLTLQEKQAKIEEIRDAFHFTLMNLAGRTGMTATEVMTINEERARLWAPYQGRVQEEFLAPKVMRRFSILWRAGQLPPPPEEMGGVGLQVTYQSAAAAAAKSSQGASTVRLLETLMPLAQIDPRAADRLDADGVVEVLADAYGTPAKVLRSRDAADQIAEARAQQQQQAMALQAAQSGAGALKDLASAAGQMPMEGV